MWFILFDILWMIICDIEICFSFEWLFVIQLLVSFEFYNNFLFWFFIIHINLINTKISFFFLLIKSDKQINTINPFNKWVVLGLRNPNPFNKHVELGLTHTVEYSWVDTTWTWHANTNCLPYSLVWFYPIRFR